MNKENKNIVIVGASLAGSFCAYLLSSRGIKVTLIDGNDLPKYKACGEGLSLIGKRYLAKAGLWDGVLSASSIPFYGYDVTFSTGENTRLSSKEPSGYAISREIIDNRILKAATEQASVTFLKSKVLSVSKAGNQWQILSNNGEFKAANVIIACGMAGRSLYKGIPSSTSEGESRFGISLRAEGSWEGDAGGLKKVIIKHFNGFQILLTPISKSKINLSILATKDILLKGENSKELLVNHALKLADESGFKITCQEECRGASYVCSSKPKSIREGLYYIGDTAEIFDPIGGMGMSHGLFSASLAAECINNSINFQENPIRAWKKYNTRRNILARSFQLLTAISFGLNVSENKLVKFIASRLPEIALKPVSMLTNYLPLFGAVRSCKTNKEKFKTTFNLRKQEGL